jgi:hypothetical protein
MNSKVISLVKSIEQSNISKLCETSFPAGGKAGKSA